MASFVGPLTLAATGSTGNNNHAAISVPASVEEVGIQFVVEVAGATPTVTFNLQGSVDGGTNWNTLSLLPSDSDTTATGIVKTAVGASLLFVGQAHSRFLPLVRLATSANTNITYRAELYFNDSTI